MPAKRQASIINLEAAREAAQQTRLSTKQTLADLFGNLRADLSLNLINPSWTGTEMKKMKLKSGYTG